MEQELHRPMELPPGFRFHPTDEELITHYLARKVADARFAALAVGEADLNKCEPWDLPSLAKMGEKEWYFFCLKDRKYPTGLRTNRATEAGYWKATGKDKDIFRHGNAKALVGSKKTLVFYTGRAPKGEKSGWVMHEYRLHGNKLHGAAAIVPTKAAAGCKNEWVLCRVFKKSLAVAVGGAAPAGKRGGMGMAKMNDDDVAAISHHPPLMDVSGGAGAGAVNNPAAATVAHVTCFSDALEGHHHQFFNQQTPPEAAATDHHLGLAAASSPFLSGGFEHYGPLLHHGASLVQLLEGGVYGGGGHRLIPPDMSSKQQQLPVLVPAPQPCKQQGGERERLSASQDTGLTSDVHPEISSSSGHRRFDHDHLCWGY